MTFFVEGLTSSREIDVQVRRIGEFETIEQAIAAAKQVINESLAREFTPGMSAGKLFARYQSFGEVPIIFRDDDDETLNSRDFRPFQYALERCTEMISSAPKNAG